jgi:dTDP-4-amino-4,6-dideoxygalactose transaminase
MEENGIGCGIHYPVPIHLQDAYKALRLRKGSFPVAEMCANEVVSLPMYPELTREQIEYVACQIKVFSRNCQPIAMDRTTPAYAMERSV